MKTGRYKLVGLVRLNSGDIQATLEFLDKEETFKALILHDNERKEAMWSYCEGDWANKKLATITCNGFYLSGAPINPVVTEIFHA